MFGGWLFPDDFFATGLRVFDGLAVVVDIGFVEVDFEVRPFGGDWCAGHVVSPLLWLGFGVAFKEPFSKGNAHGSAKCVTCQAEMTNDEKKFYRAP